eukprot:4639091-Alexandrium_andersonii.AAC.1
MVCARILLLLLRSEQQHGQDFRNGPSVGKRGGTAMLIALPEVSAEANIDTKRAAALPLLPTASSSFLGVAASRTPPCSPGEATSQVGIREPHAVSIGALDNLELRSICIRSAWGDTLSPKSQREKDKGQASEKQRRAAQPRTSSKSSGRRGDAQF